MKKNVQVAYPLPPRYASSNPRVFFLPEGEIVDPYNDCVILPEADYVSIFGTEKRAFLPIVKISHNGKSIQRRCLPSSAIQSNNVALTLTSLEQLTVDVAHLLQVNLSRGSVSQYFKKHPVYTARMGARTAVMSLAIDIIALIIAPLAI